MANEHAKCLKALGVNISRVISSNGSTTVNTFMSQHGIEKKFLNLEDALKDKDSWDAAIICCNEKFLYTSLETLVTTNKPLLVEKPISSDPKDLEKLIPYKNVIVGFNRRFYSNITFLRSELENKKVDLVKVCIPESITINEKFNRRSLPKNVFSNSIHIFDLLLFLFGNISWHASTKSISEERLRCCSLLGSSEKNISFSLDLPFDYPENFSISIYAEEILYVLRPLEILKIYKGMAIQEPLDQIPHRTYEPILKSSLAAEIHQNLKTGLFEQDKSFIKFCKSEEYDKNLARVDDISAALNSILKVESLVAS